MGAIKFDQLRISDDGTKLFIDASIDTAVYEYYSVAGITEVTVCIDDEVSESNHYTKYIYRCLYNDIPKPTSVSLILDKATFDETFINTPAIHAPTYTPTATEAFNGADLSHNLFFVYIKWEGTPIEGTCPPCDMTPSTYGEIGVTFDYGIIYNNAMNYTRELAADCSIPTGFIDFILNLEALKASLNTGHYTPAKGFYNTLIGKNKGVSSVKGCGCHG